MWAISGDYGTIYRWNPTDFSTKTNLILGFKTFDPDGTHMGWIQLGRWAAHPSVDWKIVAYARNPEPEAPILAGFPPVPRPRLEYAEDVLTVSWASQSFPGWSVEVTHSLDPPVKWSRIDSSAGPPVALPASDSPLFVRLAQ